MDTQWILQLNPHNNWTMIVMEKKKTNMIWQHPNLIANYMHSLLLSDALHNDNNYTAAVTRDLPRSPARYLHLNLSTPI